MVQGGLNRLDHRPVLVRRTDGHEEEDEDQEGDYEVGHRAGQDDDGALPNRLGSERRGYSSGVGSWKGFIPAMRTYPPAGMAFTPYSVSPRRNDHRRGPKPMKNSSILMPNSLAEKKWPAS